MTSHSHSTAVARALQERTLRGHYLSHGAPMPPCEDIAFALTDFKAAAEKIAASKSDAPVCSVAAKGPPRMRFTSLGDHLIEATNRAWPLIASARCDLHFDPVIQELANELRKRNILGMTRQACANAGSQAHAWADILNGAALQYRKLATSRAFFRVREQHKQAISDRLRALKDYFDRIAKQAPDASAYHVELRVPQSGQNGPFNPFMMADCHWRWAKEADDLFGDSIAGQAFKIDSNDRDGLFVHAVLVVKNAGSERSRVLVTTGLAEIWRAVTRDNQAELLDCNTLPVPLEYRANTARQWPMSLREELHNAAIYLVATDSLYRWDFADQCAASGYGETPHQHIAWNPNVFSNVFASRRRTAVPR